MQEITMHPVLVRILKKETGFYSKIIIMLYSNNKAGTNKNCDNNKPR